MTGTATRLIAHLPTLLDIISNDKVGRGDRGTWALALSSLRVRHVRYGKRRNCVHFSCDMGNGKIQHMCCIFPYRTNNEQRLYFYCNVRAKCPGLG